jgi:membrane-associated phospholipid phosphatase
VTLSSAADRGRLWMAIAGALAIPGGRSRRAAARGLASLAVSSFLANVVIKSLFRRARPRVVPGSLTDRVRAPRTSSFPSGHAASASAFATGAALEAPVLAPPLAILALGVGWSRVRVGVHRPVEVLAGAGLGLTVALAGGAWPTGRASGRCRRAIRPAARRHRR